ncbi:hypothetical protein BDV23DRAFT_151279 [Aspergillus alliaceus]|uniref:Uncharacterized protein n=1 Tax=Petromyces alliaceus TaxID=209559 RepID=A0A5N7CFC1_PETAA|nr:hypothetical protein BDV23DRAFT_151279 [Aspergillus alliaceus]
MKENFHSHNKASGTATCSKKPLNLHPCMKKKFFCVTFNKQSMALTAQTMSVIAPGSSVEAQELMED